MVVCLPGAKIEAITERVENIVGSGKLSAAVDSGMGTMTNILGSKHCLN